MTHALLVELKDQVVDRLYEVLQESSGEERPFALVDCQDPLERYGHPGTKQVQLSVFVIFLLQTEQLWL